MRLIDADEAIINFGVEWDDIPPTREEFVRFLKKQSIIDAVPVVRCRGCKYHNKPTCPMRLSFNWTKDDDFCSYEERKEGADNG